MNFATDIFASSRQCPSPIANGRSVRLFQRDCTFWQVDGAIYAGALRTRSEARLGSPDPGRVLGISDCEKLGQAHPTSRDPALDRAHRHPADLRGFLIG